MRILLIGADGQVGTELQTVLPALGEVMPTTRDGSVGQRLELGDREAVVAAVQDASPDLVINASGYTHVDEAEDEPDQAHLVNAAAVEVLAGACRIAGAPLVHYSTDYVFDGNTDHPYTEKDTPSPLNVYGASKLAGENALRQSGVPHLILRTSWVFAARGHNFLLTMLRLAQHKDELDIVDDQFGSPTWARFVAQGTARALETLAGGDALAENFREHGGTYHLTAAGEASWYGLAVFLLEYAGQLSLVPRVPELNPITSDEFPARARRPARSVLDCSRFVEVFGWKQPSWQTGVRKCLDGLAEAL